MKNKIVIVGFVCASLMAVAQSNNSNAQASKTTTHARDAASGGQSTAVRESPSKSSLRESPSKASLRESPSKSSLRESPSKASLRESPSKATLKLADMDGDGKADKTTPSSSQGDAIAPRDSSSGMATGKRQHPAMPPQSAGSQADRESSAPSVSEITVTKASDASPRVAAGDVNGDGRPDVAVTGSGSSNNGQNAAINNSHSNIKNSRDAGSGQASGKRQHEPIQIKKTLDVSSPK